MLTDDDWQRAFEVVTLNFVRFVRAVTRGNGVEGDDVTANVRTIRSLPRELRASAEAPLRRSLATRSGSTPSI